MLAVDVHPSVLHGKDHNLVECKWKFRTAESKLGIPRRNFARADYIGISNALCAINWKVVFSGCRIINEYWLTLYHILLQLIYDYVPMTVICCHVTNRRHLPKDVRTTILRKRPGRGGSAHQMRTTKRLMTLYLVIIVALFADTRRLKRSHCFNGITVASLTIFPNVCI